MRLIIALLMTLWLAACGGAPQATEKEATRAEQVPPKAADESAAIATLADINTAQADYFRRNRRYALTYDELLDALFLKKEPSAADTGYEIRMRPSADAGRYSVVATPVATTPDTRHFFTDQTGSIRAEQGKEATAASSAIEK